MMRCEKHGVNLRPAETCHTCDCDSLWQQPGAGQRLPAPADAIQVGGQHYKDMAMPPWEVMQAVLTREEFVGFLKGNIIKYSLRAGKKAGASDDAEKAKHYAQKLAEVQKC